MKKTTTIYTCFIVGSIIATSCTDFKPKNTADLNQTMDTMEMNIPDSLSEASMEEEAALPEGIRYKTHNYTKKYEEKVLEKGPSHALDFRDRDGDKFIGIKFADGHSGTLVLRNGHYYNYTIREKTEVRFATKEDGLQRIWDDSRLLQDAGAKIGEIIATKK